MKNALREKIIVVATMWHFSNFSKGYLGIDASEET